ncbi:MAG: thiamine phosphate synthase [Cytophagales bacterium]|nr:thiamine phosphate synthase [Cytophagales bacterium]
MTSEFISTDLATGWIHYEADESFSESAFAHAKSLGFIDIEAHVIARMSIRARLPSITPLQAKADVAFQPLLDKNLGLYVIVDSSHWVTRVLQAGVKTVQLRMKDAAHGDLRREIKTSIAAAHTYGAQLFINDHWRLALEEGAYGVHIGQEDLDNIGGAQLQAIADQGLRLGISTHAYWEVCKALAIRPSYIACGPIHPTFAKAMPWIPQGNGNLAYWCSKLHPLGIPVVAIAGMDAARATEAMRCGASSVAVISAVTAAADPESVIGELQAAIALGRTLPKWPVPNLARPTLTKDTP